MKYVRKLQIYLSLIAFAMFSSFYHVKLKQFYSISDFLYLSIVFKCVFDFLCLSYWSTGAGTWRGSIDDM